MDRLRAEYPKCDDFIAAVVVTQASGGHGKWMAQTVLREGALEPADCHSARVAITNGLHRRFHLVSSD